MTSHESQVEPPEVVADDEADEQEDGGRQDSVAVAAKLDFSLLLRDKAKAMMRFLSHKKNALLSSNLFFRSSSFSPPVKDG